MKLLDTNQYYNLLLKKIPQANSRIVLAAMVLLADSKTMPVLDAILAAQARGVKVTVLSDPFGYRPSNSYLPRRLLKIILKDTKRVLNELSAKGAAVILVDKPKLNPFKGRCHVKVTLIDNEVISFGGVNFAGGGFEQTDYMLEVQDMRLASKLESLVANIKAETEDFSLAISGSDVLLYDGGKKYRSVIYDKACELAKDAEKIYFVSQMAPSGVLGKIISGRHNECYFNRPALSRKILTTSLIIDGMFSGINNLYIRSDFIHAKFILFELKDGSKALISGSNNFSWRGVKFGTKEIAVLSSDQILWQQLYRFMRSRIS